MKSWLKWTLVGGGGTLALVGLGLGGFVAMQTSAYDEAMEKTYDIPAVELNVEITPELLARGKHLTKSIAACGSSECHGSDMAGGTPIEMGPLGTMRAPNITKGGLGAVYSDAELARLMRHGVNKAGKSVTFMPVHENNFLPDEDVAATIAYIRSLPASDKPSGAVEVGVLGKIMDRQDNVIFNVAERINHDSIETAGPPQPNAKYGRYLGRLCTGCHGETYGGGAIPGAPPDMPIPSNLTPHASGLKDYSFGDFEKLLDQGIKRDGQKLDPFMPLSMLKNMNETERRALYEFLRTVPPKEFGSR